MDPGFIMIGGLLMLGLLAGGLTVLVGVVKNPPRPAQWRPNPIPGRGPYWDRGRPWSDLIGRAALVGFATMFFIVPGVLLVSMGAAASSLRR